MAHFFVNADKDATLLVGQDVFGSGSYKNTGLDEILEVGKQFASGSRTSIETKYRSIIAFDISELSASMASGDIPSDAKFYLKMYDAGSQELQRDQLLYAYPVSQSWVEGSGKMSDDPQTSDGVSWQYRDQYSGSQWHSGSADGTQWGGSYFSGSANETSQSFGKNDKTDMRMDVTKIVKQWYSGSKPNEGFLVKRSSAEEISTEKLGHFKFFSSDTHTVFPPTLECEWDDSTWAVGSLTALSSSELDKLSIKVENFNPEYKVGSLSLIRVKGREKYPARTFATSSQYLTVKYLPSGSCWYSIVDSKTEDVIVPFGPGSKLSCDANGNYFRLRTKGLQPERFYDIKFKVVSGSGVNQKINYYDGHDTFKVVR